MKNLEIPASHGIYLSPSVNFNLQTGICEIAGESYLENTAEFYAPLMEWLELYCARHQEITFNFRISYFNTSSSKALLDIMCLLKDFQEKKGGKANINWYYSYEDLDIMSDAEDLMYEAQIKMKLIPYY